MKKYNIIFWLSIVIGLYNSCISEYNLLNTDTTDSILVVEAHIMGNSTNHIYLSRTTNISSENSFVPESGAEIFLQSNGERISEIATEYEAGKYTLKVGDLNTELSYQLFISTSGDIYQSEEASPLSTPEIDEITWDKKEKGEPVNVYISTHDNNNQIAYYKWTFEEEWEFSANEYTFFFYDIETLSFYKPEYNMGYYCWNKDFSKKIHIASTNKLTENRIKDFKINEVPCDDIKLSLLYSINIKQHKLSKEGYEYYLAKKTLNEDLGGIFAPQPSELTGNIRCTSNPDLEVIGHIEITTNISEKRLFISGDDVYEYPKERDYLCNEVDVYLDVHLRPDPKQTYLAGFRPVSIDGINWLYWVKQACLDCRATGTKNKPTFWPNDHK